MRPIYATDSEYTARLTGARCYAPGRRIMFALALHPPPATIPYTGWHARRDYGLKRASPADATAAGAAAAKAADGTKVSPSDTKCHILTARLTPVKLNRSQKYPTVAWHARHRGRPLIWQHLSTGVRSLTTTLFTTIRTRLIEPLKIGMHDRVRC